MNPLKQDLIHRNASTQAAIGVTTHDGPSPLRRRPLLSLLFAPLVLLPLFGCEQSHEGHDHGDPKIGHSDHSDEPPEGAAHEDRHGDDGDPDDHIDHAEDDDDDHGSEDDHADHDPWEVDLTDAQVTEANLRTEAATSRVLDVVMTATAVVGDNLDAQAHVTPRLGGQVREIYGRLGQRVEAGDPLCEIDSVDLGVAVSAVLGTDAEWRAATRALEQERGFLDNAVAIAQTIYDREKDLSDREISTLRPLYDAEKSLHTTQAERDRRVIELETKLEQARILRDGSMRRLRILGVDPDTLGDEEASQAARAGRYRIDSSRDGVIVDRDITLNEFVDSEDVIYQVQDLKKAWVLVSVFEHDLSKVRLGATTRVRLNAFPDDVIEGTVAFIDFHVDRDSRAASVRIEVDNVRLAAWEEDYPVRPGMFGSADITISSRSVEVSIPEAAIVHEDGSLRVFVKEGHGEYHGRLVTVSAPVGGYVEVLSGIEAGEQVVVAGTFFLKSKARGEELGGGHSH